MDNLGSCLPRTTICKLCRPLPASMAWLSPPRTTPPVWVAVDGELGVHVRSVMTKVGLHAFDKVLNNG